MVLFVSLSSAQPDRSVRRLQGPSSRPGPSASTEDYGPGRQPTGTQQHAYSFKPSNIFHILATFISDPNILFSMCGSEWWEASSTRTTGPEKDSAFVSSQPSMCTWRKHPVCFWWRHRWLFVIWLLRRSNRDESGWNSVCTKAHAVFCVFRFGSQSLTLSKIVPHICNLLGDPTSQVTANDKLLLHSWRCDSSMFGFWLPSAGQTQTWQLRPQIWVDVFQKKNVNMILCRDQTCNLSAGACSPLTTRPFASPLRSAFVAW